MYVWLYCEQCSDEDCIREGVDLTGTIVLVKYGGIFRGLKVMLSCTTTERQYVLNLFPQVKGAEELGAAGVLIYSDPADDGSVTVENGYLPYVVRRQQVVATLL